MSLPAADFKDKSEGLNTEEDLVSIAADTIVQNVLQGMEKTEERLQGTERIEERLQGTERTEERLQGTERTEERLQGTERTEGQLQAPPPRPPPPPVVVCRCRCRRQSAVHRTCVRSSAAAPGVSDMEMTLCKRNSRSKAHQSTPLPFPKTAAGESIRPHSKALSGDSNLHLADVTDDSIDDDGDSVDSPGHYPKVKAASAKTDLTCDQVSEDGNKTSISTTNYCPRAERTHSITDVGRCSWGVSEENVRESKTCCGLDAQQNSAAKECFQNDVYVGWRSGPKRSPSNSDQKWVWESRHDAWTEEPSVTVGQRCLDSQRSEPAVGISESMPDTSDHQANDVSDGNVQESLSPKHSITEEPSSNQRHPTSTNTSSQQQATTPNTDHPSHDVSTNLASDCLLTSAMLEMMTALDVQVNALWQSLRSLTFDPKVRKEEEKEEDWWEGKTEVSAQTRKSRCTGASLTDAEATLVMQDEDQYYDCISPPESYQQEWSSSVQRHPASRRVLSAVHLTDHNPTSFPGGPEGIAVVRSQRHAFLKDGKSSKHASLLHPDQVTHESGQQQRPQTTTPGEEGTSGSKGVYEELTKLGTAISVKSTLVRLSNTRSLPALLPTTCKEDCSIEEAVCTQRSKQSFDRQGGKQLHLGQVQNQRGGLDGRPERRGGSGAGSESVHGRTLKDPYQVFRQSEMLKSAWDKHKAQLKEVLCERDKESGKARRLEQSLHHARQQSSALKQQRREIQHQMERKEEEMGLALRYHRNEAAFLRRKVLTYLEEKKAAMAEEKCEGRLKPMLETLLSLYLDRERFLSLDLAKQNKINELKLLVVRQQLAMEELKEHNADLNLALGTLMQFLPEQGPKNSSFPKQPRTCTSPPVTRVGRVWPCSAGRGCGGRGMGLSDVLHCERSLYLPGHSTSPELAAVAVYGVGGEQSALTSPPEEVFDASRQFCQADGDNNSHNTTTSGMNSGNNNMDNDGTSQAEKLLVELTLHGPGSPHFSLSDAHP